MSEPSSPPHWQLALLERHRLDSTYLDTIARWFEPLARDLAALHQSKGRPVLIGINGCQGSGKTTLCDYLCDALHLEHGLNTVALSLDDFYLTKDQRQQLASEVHPLFSTRGVPGTHDLGLLSQTLDNLLLATSEKAVAIPRFDKAVDDRRPEQDWDSVKLPVNIVLLEGWCLGVEAQDDRDLAQPVNALEQEQDPDALWRSTVNGALEQEFTPLYRRVDQWLMLQAPSFDCVFSWRREQERKLADTLSPEQAKGLMDDEELQLFIQHYERLTRQCLSTLPDRVDHLFRLDAGRNITGYTRPTLNGLQS